MIENTPYNRQKYFAANFGGELIFLRGNYNNPTGTIRVIDADTLKYFSIFHHNNRVKTAVLLTPLSQIKDEGFIEACKFFYETPFMGNNNRFWKVKRKGSYVIVENKYNYHSFTIDLIDGFIDLYHDNLSATAPVNNIYDHWRSKGVAVPWMGAPVETLIEWSWLVLRKEGEA